MRIHITGQWGRSPNKKWPTTLFVADFFSSKIRYNHCNDFTAYAKEGNKRMFEIIQVCKIMANMHRDCGTETVFCYTIVQIEILDCIWVDYNTTVIIAQVIQSDQAP